MPGYLCISVTFLDPLFHGKSDGSEPEWPPSPMRLYQALLAGSRAGCRNCEQSESSDAFRWLEQQKAPVIITPMVRRAPPCTIFVPNNDSDKVVDRQERLTKKVLQPHRMLDGEILHYLWTIDEHDEGSKACAELLCGEARHLMALGWGIDQVVGNGRILNEAAVAALPGQRWRVWEGHRPGQRTYRVPISGSLDDLEGVHQSFLERVDGKQYRPPRKLKKYDSVSYIRKATLPPRSWAVFELHEGVGFRQEDTVKIAAMLRSLTCRSALEDTHQFPCEAEQYVAGHIKDDDRRQPRFSYLPLPTIGHAFADGMIRRLMIAEPFGGDGTHARWAQNRLRNASLKNQTGKDVGVLLDLWRPSSEEMIRKYVGQSRAWCSVTPVILPGYDDFKSTRRHDDTKQPTKAERLLLKCLIHAGIPIEAVESVTLRRAPYWPGSQHPRHYHRPDYLADHHARPGWHVRVVFREPMAGPLSVGAGRHCGLGILAACEQ
jgi:CRISPR-associated protein Csb2